MSIKNSFNFFSFPPEKTFRDSKEIFAINYLQCWLLKEKQIETEKTIFGKKKKRFLTAQQMQI